MNRRYTMQFQVVIGGGDWRNVGHVRTVTAPHASAAARRAMESFNAKPDHHRVLVFDGCGGIPLIFHPDGEEEPA